MRSLNECHTHRLRIFGPLANVELNPLVLLQRSITVADYFSVVNEYVFCAAVRSDKTEALLAVKPFHSALCHTFQLLSFKNGCTKNILTEPRTSNWWATTRSPELG